MNRGTMPSRSGPPTTRRRFLTASTGTALSGLLASAQQAASRPPNLLFVLSDDHSVPYLGTYGSDWLRTPNLDRFGNEGMVFEQAFTAAPQCVPSRTALLTGKSPVAAQMGRFTAPLPRNVITVPEVLRERGYYTGVCGRYFHLDGPPNPSPVTRQIYDKHQLKTWRNRVDFLDISQQQKTTPLFADFLTQAPKDRPWFFWINYNDPHHPWDTALRNIDPASVKVPGHLPDLQDIQQTLMAALQEKIVIDADFVPPILPEVNRPQPPRQTAPVK